MSDESRFDEVWGGFDGTIREDVLQSFQADAYSRSQVSLAYDRYQFLGPASKACLLRFLLPAAKNKAFADRLRASYCAYLILRGPNFFFGPRYDDGTDNGVPQPAYGAMQSALGLPVANASYTYYDHGDGTSGWRLYQRQTKNGIVYLNWSGVSRTVALPAGNTYHDRNGQAVTTLTIPDLSAEYVTSP